MRHKRHLNSDELGHKGELHFATVCNDAHLVANRVDRDRNGWDFIVDFPFRSDGPPTSLDKRDAPISCRVQVKTIWHDNEAVELRLSAAERLAKDPKPTFIYVLKIDDNGQAVRGHLIHLLDNNLAKILKRLRREHARGNQKINRHYISFNVNAGVEIEPSGEALAQTITRMVDARQSSYVETKAEQLRRLGFEDGGHKISLTVVASSYQELVDASLGLRPLTFTQRKHVETRFGIELPIFENMNGKKGTLKISPNPKPCRVVFRNDKVCLPAAVEGEVIFPGIAQLPSEYLRVCIRCALFSIFIPYEADAFNLSIDTDALRKASHSIDEWRKFHRVLRLMSKPGTEIKCTTDDLPVLEFKTNQGGTLMSPEHVAQAEKACEQITNLAERIGAATPHLTLEEIDDCRDQVDFCQKLIQNVADGGEIEFQSDLPDALQTTSDMSMNYYVAFEMGKIAVGYFVPVTMRVQAAGDHAEWCGVFNGFGDIQLLRDTDADFDRFVNETSEKTGVQAAFVNRPTRLDRLDAA